MELTHTKIVVYSHDFALSQEIQSFESLTINQKLSAKISEFSFVTSTFDETLISQFGTGAHVYIYSTTQDKPLDDLALMYIGTVDKNPKDLDGVLKTYQISGTDKLGQSQYILVNEAYQNVKITDIVRDLLGKYADGLYEEGYIQDSSYTITISFKDTHLYTALEKLADVLTYTFNVDLFGFFNFQEMRNTQSDIPLLSDDYLKGTASFEQDATGLINSYTAYGGIALTPDYTQYVKGDGLNSTYLFNYKPRASTSGAIQVYLNDVAQSVGISGIDSPGVGCVVNYNEKNITFKNSVTNADKILLSTDIVRLVYREEIKLIARIDDKPSIAKYGLRQDIIRFPEITDRVALYDRTKEELKRTSAPLTSGSLTTYKNVYRVGDVVEVKITTDEGFFINQPLQITEKVINIVPNDMTVELRFEQKLNLSELIKSILERLTDLEKSGELQTVEQIDYMNDTVLIKGVLKLLTPGGGGFIIGKSKIGTSLGG